MARIRGVQVAVVALLLAVGLSLGAGPVRAASLPSVQASSVAQPAGSDIQTYSESYDPDGLYRNPGTVACAGDGSCVAVGDDLFPYDGDEREGPVEYTETGGVWSAGQSLPLPPDGASGDVTGDVGSTACVVGGDCVAAGYFDCSAGASCPQALGGALIDTEVAGKWSAGQITSGTSALQAESVACASASDCTVVGDDGGTSGNDAWLAQGAAGGLGDAQARDAAPSGSTDSGLERVECAADGPCAATGFDNAGAPIVMYKTADGTWSTATTAPLPSGAMAAQSALVSVACSSSACFASGSYEDSSGTTRGLIEMSTGGAWSIVFTSGDGYSTIACPITGACVATGNDDSTLDVSNASGTWAPLTSTTQDPPKLDGADTGAFMCTSRVECYSEGYDVLQESGGTVAPVEHVTSPSDCSNAAAERDGYGEDFCAGGFSVVTACAASSCVSIGGYPNGSSRAEYGFATVDGGIVVNSAGDQPDATPGDSACETAQGTCTLRAAIQELNAEAPSSPVKISFDIPSVPSGQLATITPATALPAITAPVSIDATGQPGALTAGSRTIGVILDGTNAGSGAAGLDLASGAEGSTIQGVQVQNFSGDGVKLGGATSQLADSVLVGDATGAEVAASGVTVGAENGLPGDIFFRDGRFTSLVAGLTALKGHGDEDAFASTVAAYGGGVVLTGASTGTSITGDLIGVHGPGFSAAPDALAADGPASTNLASDTTLMSSGVLIDPLSGEISDVTVDGNTISGAGFGLAAFTGASGSIVALGATENAFGAAADGTAFPLFGEVFGAMVAGNVTGLQLGAPGVGNTFQGDYFGATLLGSGVSAPIVQGNTFGNPDATFSSDAGGLGSTDLFAVTLADVQGATVGGTGTGAGNELAGLLSGATLAGANLGDDAITGNAIGTDNPTALGPLANADFGNFAGVFGVLYLGNAGASGTASTQDIGLDQNTIEGDGLGVLAENGTGLTLTDNTIASDAIGISDTGGVETHVGADGHGNTLADDGFGLMLGNAAPSSSEDQTAQVNADVSSASGQSAQLNQPNTNVGYDAIDALSTATLGPSSIAESTVPGTGDTILGNRFGVDASGDPEADSIPVAISGAETGVALGGVGSGQGNTIEDNRVTGVLVGGTSSSYPTVQILGNTIDNNENFTETSATGIPGLGIDLGLQTSPGTLGTGPFGLGVNAQDQTQPDHGPDNLQNAPVLSGATLSNGQLTVTGTLHGVPSTSYLLELFDDDNANPFGAGEGERLLGRPTLTTNSSGNATFSATYAAPPSSARFVSATATTLPPGDAVGVTSEFSVDAQIAAPAAASTPSTTSTAAPTPAPAPAVSTGVPSGVGSPGGVTGVSGGGARISASRATITLPAIVTCSSAAASDCTVTTRATVVTTNAQLARLILADRAKRKQHGKRDVVGRGAQTLRPGGTAKLKLKLTRAGFRLLKAKHRLALTVTVTITGRDRATVTHTLKVTLRYRKAKRRR